MKGVTIQHGKRALAAPTLRPALNLERRILETCRSDEWRGQETTPQQTRKTGTVASEARPTPQRELFVAPGLVPGGLCSPYQWRGQKTTPQHMRKTGTVASEARAARAETGLSRQFFASTPEPQPTHGFGDLPVAPVARSGDHATAQILEPKTSRRGLAMLEVITALFIVTFGIFSVLTMYHVGMANARALREHGLVMNALENELEGLRAMPFETLPHDWNDAFRATAPDLGALVNARPHVRIQPFENRQDLLEIRSSIRWSGEHGRTIEKSLTTLIADKPARGM